jgi:hypothetical protein
MGVGYCEAAGYNPTASIDFIQRLLEEEKRKEEESKVKGSYKLSPIFNTHPPSQARALKVAELLEGKGPFPPKMLSFNPGKLFYAPMKWSDQNSQIVKKKLNSKEEVNKDPVFFHESFESPLVVLGEEDEGRLSGAWYLKGPGAWRQVGDNVAIGHQSLKLWSSGEDTVTFETYPMSLPQSLNNAVVEVIVSGERTFDVRLVVILSAVSGIKRTIPLAATIEGEQGGWRLFRASDFSPVEAMIKNIEATGDSFVSLSLGLLFPEGIRGALWIDELRFGNTPDLRLLDSSSVFANSITKSGKDIFYGWKVLRGQGSLVEVLKADKEIAGTHNFVLSPPEGERYATMISGPFDVSRLRGGYMLYFNARASNGVRLFAGLDYRTSFPEDDRLEASTETVHDESDETPESVIARVEGEVVAGEWKPAGNTNIDKTWKRLRLISDEKPVNNGNCHVRFEFSSTTKDFKVFIDEVILVSLLKPNAL